MAIASEAGELLELFQWLSVPESKHIMDDPKKAAAVGEEIADVLIYLVRLADILKIDLLQVADQKIESNARKYPISAAKGTARKYNDLGEHCDSVVYKSAKGLRFLCTTAGPSLKSEKGFKAELFCFA